MHPCVWPGNPGVNPYFDHGSLLHDHRPISLTFLAGLSWELNGCDENDASRFGSPLTRKAGHKWSKPINHLTKPSFVSPFGGRGCGMGVEPPKVPGLISILSSSEVQEVDDTKHLRPRRSAVSQSRQYWPWETTCLTQYKALIIQYCWYLFLHLWNSLPLCLVPSRDIFSNQQILFLFHQTFSYCFFFGCLVACSFLILKCCCVFGSFNSFLAAFLSG